MDKKIIKTAALEAIFWWNWNEHFYHAYMSKTDLNRLSKDELSFFAVKIFDPFTRAYSVRRTISKGFKSVITFLEELGELDFTKEVLSGNIGIIDHASTEIKAKGISTGNSTTSLLSKYAFLINPEKFILCDTLSKNSVWRLKDQNSKSFLKKDLNRYSDYHSITVNLTEEILNSENEISSILSDFKDSTAGIFFRKNKEAFHLRILDKYLWLYDQQGSDKDYDNSVYKKYYQMVGK